MLLRSIGTMISYTFTWVEAIKRLSAPRSPAYSAGPLWLRCYWLILRRGSSLLLLLPGILNSTYISISAIVHFSHCLARVFQVTFQKVFLTVWQTWTKLKWRCIKNIYTCYSGVSNSSFHLHTASLRKLKVFCTTSVWSLWRLCRHCYELTRYPNNPLGASVRIFSHSVPREPDVKKTW